VSMCISWHNRKKMNQHGPSRLSRRLAVKASHAQTANF
jgi:hypothetical protein